MNSATTNKKKISEYQIEDIKELFLEVFRKISSKVILLEIGNDFLNIALAKAQKNRLHIKKVFRQNLPSEALEKSIQIRKDKIDIGFGFTVFRKITEPDGYFAWRQENRADYL